MNYDVNSVGGNFGFLYSIYANRDNTPGFAGGADFVTGHFTHSFRGSYEKFHNLISDSVTGNSSLYNPIPGVTLGHRYGRHRYIVACLGWATTPGALG